MIESPSGAMSYLVLSVSVVMGYRQSVQIKHSRPLVPVPRESKGWRKEPREKDRVKINCQEKLSDPGGDKPEQELVEIRRHALRAGPLP